MKYTKNSLTDTQSSYAGLESLFLHQHFRHGFRVDYEDLTWVPKATYPHDPPLSSEGIKQAEDLAQRLITENIEIIVSSPFTRALHTAKARLQLFYSLTFHTDNGRKT